MDTTAAGISFDADGVCNYCTELVERSARAVLRDEADRDAALARLIDRIKHDGHRKPYDCIVGVSGGVDSSYALARAVALGLRPLAVHMDNGWNSELAQHNIASLVQRLGVDLYTHVIDWEEYRGMMQAFFDADVVDVELLYDNAMLGANYRQARRQGVKWILTGSNEVTEGMHMPANWNWNKYDLKNIRSIAKGRARTFPGISVINYCIFRFASNIRWVPFLDYFDYRKEEAIAQLVADYAYKPYKFKHYESVFTRFYQGYLLPRKFDVDKRKLHLSTLVVTGQLDRPAAKSLLAGPSYESEEALQQDVAFFLKKMRWPSGALDDYLRRPRRDHSEFGSERWLWDFLLRLNALHRSRASRE